MSGLYTRTGTVATNTTILLTNKTKTVSFKTHKQRSITMQFDFEKVQDLLGKVVYIKGASLPKLEPYVVCGYDHKPVLGRFSKLTWKFHVLQKYFWHLVDC